MDNRGGAVFVLFEILENQNIHVSILVHMFALSFWTQVGDSTCEFYKMGTIWLLYICIHIECIALYVVYLFFSCPFVFFVFSKMKLLPFAQPHFLPSISSFLMWSVILYVDGRDNPIQSNRFSIIAGYKNLHTNSEVNGWYFPIESYLTI